jgi:hypothetical protein
MIQCLPSEALNAIDQLEIAGQLLRAGVLDPKLYLDFVQEVEEQVRRVVETHTAS